MLPGVSTSHLSRQPPCNLKWKKISWDLKKSVWCLHHSYVAILTLSIPVSLLKDSLHQKYLSLHSPAFLCANSPLDSLSLALWSEDWWSLSAEHGKDLHILESYLTSSWLPKLDNVVCNTESLEMHGQILALTTQPRPG